MLQADVVATAFGVIDRLLAGFTDRETVLVLIVAMVGALVVATLRFLAVAVAGPVAQLTTLTKLLRSVPDAVALPQHDPDVDKAFERSRLAPAWRAFRQTILGPHARAGHFG